MGADTDTDTGMRQAGSRECGGGWWSRRFEAESWQQDEVVVVVVVAGNNGWEVSDRLICGGKRSVSNVEDVGDGVGCYVVKK